MKMLIIIILFYMDGQKLEKYKNIFKMCFIYGLFTDSIISQTKGGKGAKVLPKKDMNKIKVKLTKIVTTQPDYTEDHIH